jgi:hypothetical protein
MFPSLEEVVVWDVVGAPKVRKRLQQAKIEAIRLNTGKRELVVKFWGK